jgi:Na+-transporting NADH:ubiquinone oxidoreductase subunit C
LAFSNTYIFGYAAVICVLCSVSLASVSLALRETQDLNRKRDLQKNILVALELLDPAVSTDGPAIDKLWSERVEQRFLKPDGGKAGPELDQDGDGDLDQVDVDIARKAAGGDVPKVLSLFVRKDGADVGAIALPVNGVGLWGPISGYLALDPTATTVLGATFSAPKETPGLGAEIAEPKFIDKWKGKKLRMGDKPAPIRVVKGEAANLCPDNLDHCVDGVSGATITCRGVDQMVVDAVRNYDAFLKNPQGAI